MAKSTLQDFLQNRADLAIKISSRDLAGFFTKKLTIPLNTAGLALFPDGAATLYREQREISGSFDLVIAKTGPISMKMTVAELKSRDDHAVALTLGLTAQIETERADLFKDFTRGFFNFPGTFSLDDLKQAFAPMIRRAVAAFVKARPVVELHKKDLLNHLGEVLSAALERELFGSGLTIEALVEATFNAPDHEKHLAAEAKRSEEAKRVEDRIRGKEERVRRLAAFLEEQSVQQLLTKISDERLKGLLYAKLMEDDTSQITANDLLSKAGQIGGEMVHHVVRAMEGLLGTGSAIDADDIESATAERVLVAAGSKIIALTPTDGAVTREFVFKDPLRSVRSVDTPKGKLLLAGARKTIHALSLSDPSDLREYPLPRSRTPKGGVNSVALHGDHFYATHSEYGLVRWDASKPGLEGEILLEDLTSRHKTTRAVIASAGYIIFASGPQVLALPLGRDLPPIRYTAPAESSAITCLAAGAGSIFAGTDQGTIITWALGEPDKASTLARCREAIVNLRLARISSIPHLFYTAKDFAVRARVIGQTLETSYEAGGSSVGVVDAASDLVAAADSGGRRLLLWRPASPSKPVLELETAKWTEKPVLDVCLDKVKAA